MGECKVCGKPAKGPFCSAACKQKAWRSKNQLLKHEILEELNYAAELKRGELKEEFPQLMNMEQDMRLLNIAVNKLGVIRYSLERGFYWEDPNGD